MALTKEGLEKQLEEEREVHAKIDQEINSVETQIETAKDEQKARLGRILLLQDQIASFDEAEAEEEEAPAPPKKRTKKA